MSAVQDLRALGADVHDSVAVARFIATLSLDGRLQALLLRQYLIEVGGRLNAEVLVAARDYSFHL